MRTNKGNKKKNILIIITALKVDGPSKIIINLINNIDSEKFKVTLISLDKKVDDMDKMGILGIPVICLGMKGFLDFTIIPKIMKIIKIYEIDLIHTQNVRPDWYGRIAARLAGKYPIISTINGEYYKYNVTNYGQLIASFVLIIDHLMNRFCSHFIVVSKAVKKMVMEKWGVPENKISLIYNGVDLNELQNDARAKESNRRKFGISETNLVIGSVMAFKKSKGYDYLSKAAFRVIPRYPQTRYLFRGDGEHKNIDKIIEAKKLTSYFVFPPAQPRISDLLNIIDIFAFPSFSEGFPMAVLEAMSMGKPVIVSDVGGCNELVLNGESGLVVKPRDIEALSAAICYLIENPGMAQKMGQNGKEYVKQNFNIKFVAKAHEELYMNVLKK